MHESCIYLENGGHLNRKSLIQNRCTPFISDIEASKAFWEGTYVTRYAVALLVISLQRRAPYVPHARYA